MSSETDTTNTPRVSLIIPCYNEARRIAATLTRCQAYLAEQSYASEIVVVDDGSQDETSAIVRSGFSDVQLISYEQNRGKGYAVTQGVLQSRGALRLFYDADGSTPIEELDNALPLLEEGAALVIGSRALPDSDVAVRQPWYRQNMGRIYNLLLRTLRLTSFPDTQCGFKVITAEAAEQLFPLITRDGYGMDCELINLVSRAGFRVEQIPVRWINSLDSRVRIIRDSLDMIREVLLIRWALTTGKYGPLGK